VDDRVARTTNHGRAARWSAVALGLRVCPARDDQQEQGKESWLSTRETHEDRIVSGGTGIQRGSAGDSCGFSVCASSRVRGCRVPQAHGIFASMRDHAADIRALRRQSNAAIASLDATYVTSFMGEAVEVSVAGGPVLTGRAANLQAWEQQMREPGFGGYVRTPEQVTVEPSGTRAHEAGHWVGRWRVKGRAHEQQGRYSAEWALGPMGWEIVREVFTADGG
jgi:ketosteroid isomerase-like protein